MGQVVVLLMLRIVILDCWDRLYTSYVSRVVLPVQRRLCPIFVRNVGSPDIHECFHGLTGSQRTPGIWGVTGLINNVVFLYYKII